jgi:hypothetical protein
MAKKKTAGPESTTGAAPAPNTTRRRATGKPDNGSTSAARPAESVSVGTSSRDAIDSAADMSSAVSPMSNATSAPSYEEIAEAAYQRYLSRGGGHGRDFEDWLEAERDLRLRH